MTFAKLTGVFCMAALAVTLACATGVAAAADIPPAPGIPAAPTDRSLRDSARDDATDSARGELGAARSTAWQRAVDESKDPDFSKLWSPRPLALIVGLAWLTLATRHMWRHRTVLRFPRARA